ncbi:MAG: cytochrome b/b6 domain-containing protein, partial [Pseudomonadota bacterium]
LYAALIALVLTGYVAASALGDTRLLFPIDRTFARSDIGETLLDAHFSLKWVLLALLTLHLGAALKHAVFDRDGTFSGMAFPSRKERDHA